MKELKVIDERIVLEKEFIKEKANENNMDMSNFIKFCVNFYLEKEDQ